MLEKFEAYTKYFEVLKLRIILIKLRIIKKGFGKNIREIQDSYQIFYQKKKKEKKDQIYNCGPQIF